MALFTVSEFSVGAVVEQCSCLKWNSVHGGQHLGNLCCVLQAEILVRTGIATVLWTWLNC